MQIHPMITFHGNCREALEFYRECFGGELVVEGFSDEIKRRLPENMRHLVVCARLIAPGFTIHGSDLGETTMGGRISLLISGGEEASRIAVLWKKLALYGKITSGPDGTGMPHIASVVDRFGVEWLFLPEKE